MKIAITVSSDDLKEVLDSRFGRAVSFMVYDLQNDEYTIHSNSQNYNAPQGAGIQSAQNVSELGVDAVVTGHCGPKAFSVLKTAGIKIYNVEPMPVADIIKLVKENKLTPADDADVESHWI